MEHLVRLSWIATLLTLASTAPAIFITAPNIIHVDVAESVAVQVEGLSSPAQINVYFENQLTGKICSDTETFNLDSTNDYIQVKKMKASASQVKNCGVETLKRQKYIQLVAKSVNKAGQMPLLTKDRKVPILLSTKKGYLFIQTDKPIYTPTQTVKFRIFALDHVMRPVQDSIAITIFNAQGMQVKKAEVFTKTSIIDQQLIIPDISDPGVWTIVARFTSAPESNSTAQFEVKKYVLPNYEVKIFPNQPFFLITEEDFDFIVEASYVYGKSVVGIAYIRFAIMDEGGEKTFLRGTEQQIKLEDGKAQVKLTRENITKALTQPLIDLKGMRLHIAVTVLETATGGLEEQELNSVKFVTSPYKVDLTKTEQYFVPGSSLNVLVGVSHTDGSVAARIPVTLNVKINGNPQPQSPIKAGSSDEHGMLIYSVNTASSAHTVEISASVGDGDKRESSTMTVSVYQSSSKSYLQILPKSHSTVKPGDSVSFQLKSITSSTKAISYLYYMVLSKGQILFLKRETKTTLTSIQFTATAEMIPSFRFVAYYYLGDEIVANSVWMDVEDSCEGKLHVQTNVRDYSHPGRRLELTIETDDHAQVALAAVDSAVYILNKKNKLTPKKVFQAMNEYDLGCTVGSGRDFKGVFKDAGLSFISSQSYSELRDGYGCKTPTRRTKRALDFQTSINDKIKRFTDELQKKCCRSGMAFLPPHMKRTCNQRSDRVSEAKCRSAFLECCTFAQEQRKKYRRVTSGLGRVYSTEEEEFEDEDDIQLRSLFPESWLWKTVTVTKKLTEKTYVPDSITTWEIQAISISQGKGFCIADPVHVKVFQPFHIHLPLPYSVKRFEQLEIRPTLYNYASIDLEMRVFMDEAEGLCSPSTVGRKEKTIVTVPKNSAVAVPFSVVPMTKQNIPITVTALGLNGDGDKISKILKIVREGVSKLEEKTYQIDFEDVAEGKLDIVGEEPSNLIPDGDFTISVRANVDSALETVNNSLAADGVSRLIRVPHGCAEQTMILVAPGLYAMNYLDETEQWTSLGPEHRDEALEIIKGGSLRILNFRKTDGSYGAWLHSPSSTWLTAFIAKILSICRHHVTVDDDHILTAVAFILQHQDESTGAFRDPAPVWHREMQGGVGGVEVEVSLTAFVTIALHHTMEVHTGQSKSNVRKSIEKAERYLHQKLPTLKRPYSVAISAYALTLVSNTDAIKEEAHSYLMDFVTKSKDGRMLYWEMKDADRLQSEIKTDRVPSAAAITVEGTAFALLHMLLRNDIPTANKIVTWLTEQQNYGGGFKSTQDTVVALEALSCYWTKTFSTEAVHMGVTITSPGRAIIKNFRVDENTKHVQEHLPFSLGNNLHVELEGKGKGTLTILRLFNVMQVENSTCQHMKLEVELTEEVQEIDDAEDYGTDYDDGEEANDEPFAPIHWQDLRRRRRREAGQPQDNKKMVVYKVCLWRVNKQSGGSGMAIVDITMLSGFVPEMEDLNKLKDLEDRYISHYEYQHGRLVLYFPSVPDEKECISFQAAQNIKVGLLQPASATLYDFYEPDQKCSIFYNLPSKSRLVSALCTEEVCQCAEGPCPQKKVTLAMDETRTPEPRQNHACYSPRVKYGYRGRVVELQDQNAFVVYKVLVLEVLQRTKDEKIKVDNYRNFIQRKACKMQLSKGKDYLLMGQDGDTYDGSGELQYLLEANSWIEELASQGSCKATRNRAKCQQVQNFMEIYRTNGCMV